MIVNVLLWIAMVFLIGQLMGLMEAITDPVGWRAWHGLAYSGAAFATCAACVLVARAFGLW